MDALFALVRESLVVTAVLCLPVLGAATLAGALVAVLQAATQVQEQTLTLLPKVLTVAALAAAFGRFGLDLCASLVRDAVALAPQLVR